MEIGFDHFDFTAVGPDGAQRIIHPNIQRARNDQQSIHYMDKEDKSPLTFGDFVPPANTKEKKRALYALIKKNGLRASVKTGDVSIYSVPTLHRALMIMRELADELA